MGLACSPHRCKIQRLDPPPCRRYQPPRLMGMTSQRRSMGQREHFEFGWTTSSEVGLPGGSSAFQLFMESPQLSMIKKSSCQQSSLQMSFWGRLSHCLTQHIFTLTPSFLSQHPADLWPPPWIHRTDLLPLKHSVFTTPLWEIYIPELRTCQATCFWLLRPCC